MKYYPQFWRFSKTKKRKLMLSKKIHVTRKVYWNKNVGKYEKPFSSIFDNAQAENEAVFTQ